MSERILVVTPPDDILLQGIRILHVELTDDQSSLVSNALMNCQSPYTMINYVWKMGNPVDWLLDKIPKCDLIIFNAEGAENCDLIIGWIAAQPQSYYFGYLKDLHMANDRAIFNSEGILNLLEKISTYYEQTT